MRTGLITLFTAISLTVFGQQNQTINLKWKIEKNETLNYLTEMSEIDTATYKAELGKILKSLSDSTVSGLKESKKLFKKFDEEFKNQNYIFTLSNKGEGVVDIVMVSKPKEQVKESKSDTTNHPLKGFQKMTESLTKGVLLRGSVYETGGIHSFWVKSSQKNLISTFFELPKKPVKVGDKWSLDINLISNDQSFVCDTSYKINEVTLAAIRETKEDTIAVLKYNIVEYVEGNFESLSSLKQGVTNIKTTMKFHYQGISEFSIAKGRWISYNGIMGLESTGALKARQKSKFTLSEE
ncbi:MAG TPA: hypothetical protein VK168_12715 [Saprospiraceae bacterium]|nr:hypothetical protein [Saprospiraceae bacterium]